LIKLNLLLLLKTTKTL